MEAKYYEESFAYLVNGFYKRGKSAHSLLHEHHTDKMKTSSFFTPMLNIKLEFDKHPHWIKVNQHMIKLTSREYAVLQYLAHRKNKTVTREELLKSVWSTAHVNYLRTVDATIKRIREKLTRKTPAGSFIIRTERSRGYRFMDPSLETG